MVETLPCNAGDMALIPGQGTKIPHGEQQLSWRTTLSPDPDKYIN